MMFSFIIRVDEANAMGLLAYGVLRHLLKR
jgi:hypothetical protein